MGELRHPPHLLRGEPTGLAFYIAILHFGPSTNLTAIRDRLIGVSFVLIVLGIVEHLLWPVSAAKTLHTCVAELMHLLAELARNEAGSEAQAMTQKGYGFLASTNLDQGRRDPKSHRIVKVRVECVRTSA